MAGSTEKNSKPLDTADKKPRRSWLLPAGLGVLIVCGLAVGVAVQPLRFEWAVWRFGNPDPVVRMRAAKTLKSFGLKGNAVLLSGKNEFDRMRAAEKLAGMGTEGRLVLLRAVGSEDAAVRNDAVSHLLKILADDVNAGRNIATVIEAALSSMRAGGNKAGLYACIAASGWEAGLLDEETKKEIVRQCFQVKVTCRSMYPVRCGGPLLEITRYHIPINHTTEWVAKLDGRRIEGGGGLLRSESSKFVSRSVWFYTGATSAAGEHSFKAELVFQADTPEAGDAKAEDRGWKMTLESETVKFEVKANLPDDYLQAKVTPELKELVAKAVTMEEGGFSPTGPCTMDECVFRMSSSYIFADGASSKVRIMLDPPLPVDLAFKPVWHVPELYYLQYDRPMVVLKGQSEFQLNAPIFGDLAKAVLHGSDDVFSMKLVLEPSRQTALTDPEVTSYWPEPIEFPPFELKVELMKGKVISREQFIAEKLRELCGTDKTVRSRAAGALKNTGLEGRLAMVQAVRSEDDQVGEYALRRMKDVMWEDLKNGRDVKPYLEEALKGIDDAGHAGNRCAGLATICWNTDLLDEQARQAILARCSEIRIEARPEYPLDSPVGPVLKWRSWASFLSFNRRSTVIFDGVLAKESGTAYRNSLVGLQAGPHTVQGKCVVEVIRANTGKGEQSVPEGKWRTTLETEPLTFVIKESLPDDYLKAKVTPELAAFVTENLSLDVREKMMYTYEADSERVRFFGNVALRTLKPLTVDVVAQAKWHVKEMEKTYTAPGHVFIRGSGVGVHTNLEPPVELLKDLMKVTEELSVVITLEPLPESARTNPSVLSYWPEPITFPAFKLELHPLTKRDLQKQSEKKEEGSKKQRKGMKNDW